MPGRCNKTRPQGEVGGAKISGCLIKLYAGLRKTILNPEQTNIHSTCASSARFPEEEQVTKTIDRIYIIGTSDLTYWMFLGIYFPIVPFAAPGVHSCIGFSALPEVAQYKRPVFGRLWARPKDSLLSVSFFSNLNWRPLSAWLYDLFKAVSGAMVLGAPRVANPSVRSDKPWGGSIPLAPSNAVIRPPEDG